MSEGKYNERCTTSILSTDQIWESWAGPQEATLGWRRQRSPNRSGRSSLSPANVIVHRNPFLDPLLNSGNICNWRFSSFLWNTQPTGLSPASHQGRIFFSCVFIIIKHQTSKHYHDYKNVSHLPKHLLNLDNICNYVHFVIFFATSNSYWLHYTDWNMFTTFTDWKRD